MQWNVQVATWTSNNRYPGVFRTLQARIAARAGSGLGQGRLKILSFGCSNGSEVSSLRSYFPEALIYGCDVNGTALRAASDSLLMDETVLFESTPDSLGRYGPFDIILAMSILCRFPESRARNVTNFGDIYPFAAFERTVDQLARNLAPDGLLCLYNMNYDFGQTALASAFRPVRSPLLAENGFVDKFDRDGSRLTWCENAGPYFVHRPLPTGRTAGLSGYTDCIFEMSLGEAPIFVPIGIQGPAVVDGPPDLAKFGPDLDQCAREGLIGTALGYWFQESADGPVIARAWRRTTQDGRVETLTPWLSDGGPANREALAIEQGALVAHLRRETAWARGIRKLRTAGDRAFARVRSR